MRKERLVKPLLKSFQGIYSFFKNVIFFILPPLEYYWCKRKIAQSNAFSQCKYDEAYYKEKLDQEIGRHEYLSEKTRKFLIPIALMLNILFQDSILQKEKNQFEYVQIFYVISILYFFLAFFLTISIFKTGKIFGYGLKYMKNIKHGEFFEDILEQQKKNLILSNKNACIYYCLRNGAIFLALMIFCIYMHNQNLFQEIKASVVWVQEFISSIQCKATKE